MQSIIIMLENFKTKYSHSHLTYTMEKNTPTYHTYRLCLTMETYAVKLLVNHSVSLCGC